MTSIATLELELDQLAAKRSDIINQEREAITNSILPFFSDFSPEVEIEFERGSVYFRMDHPNYNYKKELFNLYLREGWRLDEDGMKFTGIDLSYYTTSTKGIDTWELLRLQLLVKVAEIVHAFHDRILDRINNDSLRFKDEMNEVYREIQEIQSTIGELRTIEYTKIKEELKKALLSGKALEFGKQVDVKLKFNHTARVTNIQLINVSKSGKTADVVYTYAGEHKGSEYNVNVENIVYQIFYKRESLIQEVAS
jgi:hypothetical protein